MGARLSKKRRGILSGPARSTSFQRGFLRAHLALTIDWAILGTRPSRTVSDASSRKGLRGSLMKNAAVSRPRRYRRPTTKGFARPPPAHSRSTQPTRIRSLDSARLDPRPLDLPRQFLPLEGDRTRRPRRCSRRHLDSHRTVSNPCPYLMRLRCLRERQQVQFQLGVR